MKKYNIPVNWIQKGVIAIKADTLTNAVDIASSIDLSTANIVGQTAPDTTRVAYNGLSTYVPDEKLYEDIVVYTSSKVPQCPFCDKAKTWLDSHGIKYTVVDIMLDRDKADKMFEITGSMAMPQIQVGNEILVGFIEEQALQAFTHYGYISQEAPTATPPTPPVNPSIEVEPKVVKMPKDDMLRGDEEEAGIVETESTDA